MVSCVYGLLAAAEGSEHFGTGLDASMRGGANVTCPALRSSLTFRGKPDQAWARRLIWRRALILTLTLTLTLTLPLPLPLTLPLPLP